MVSRLIVCLPPACFVWFQWDPFPFILLNLTLSFQAAFTAPFILMSQNRRVRHRTEKDTIKRGNKHG